MNKSNLKYIIGGLAALGVIVGLFASISSENLTYYFTPAEVLAQPAKYKETTVRVMGLVEKGTVKWEPEITKLSFKITEDRQQFLNVSYVGAKPDLFNEGQGVVVEGKLSTPDHFIATSLLVKHSEEYKVDKEGHQAQKEGYYKSLSN